MKEEGMIIFCLLILFLSFITAIISFYLIPFVIRKATHWGVLDLPNLRKAHSNPIPRLGGMSIIPALWLGCSITLLLALIFKIPYLSFQLTAFSNAVLGLLIGATGVFILGCMDDFKGLTASQKLVYQIGLTALTIHFLPLPSSVLNYDVSPSILFIFIFLWLVIVPNSVNLLDGIDGLASSMALAFLGVASFISFLRGEPGWLLILIPTFFSILIFLKFNWKPARIFLGDSGSLLLGFVVAYLSMAFALMPSTEGQFHWNPMISFLLTFVWLCDTFLAIARRYLEKRPAFKIFLRRSTITYLVLLQKAFKNICQPDKKHIHHRLLAFGFSETQSVYIITGIALSFMLLTFPLSSLTEELKMSSTYMWLPPLLSALVVALIFIQVIKGTHNKPKNESSDEQNSEELAA